MKQNHTIPVRVEVPDHYMESGGSFTRVIVVTKFPQPVLKVAARMCRSLAESNGSAG